MKLRRPATIALVSMACCAALANAGGGHAAAPAAPAPSGGGHAAAPAPSGGGHAHAPAPSGGGGHAHAPAPSGGGHAHAPAPSGGGRGAAPVPFGGGRAAGGGSRGSAPVPAYGSGGSKGYSSTSGPSSPGTSGQAGAAPGGGAASSGGGGGGATYDGGFGCGNGGPCGDDAYGGVGGDIYIINFYFLPGFRPRPAEQPYANTVGYEEHVLTGQHPGGGGGGGGRGSVPEGAVLVLDPGATAYGNPGHREQSDFPIQSRMTDLAVRYAIVMRDGTAFASTDMPKWSGDMIVGRDRTGKLFSVKGSTVDLPASRIPSQPAPSPQGAAPSAPQPR